LIDRSECNRLVSQRRLNDLARHFFESQYRCCRRAMVTINNTKLPIACASNENCAKTRPPKRTRDPIDLLPPLPTDRPSIGPINDQVVDP
jgi:hypothetical protein